MEKESARRGAGDPTTTSIDDLPDDILETILVQLPTPACLMRTAATCKPWRRVITGGGFLDRFRSIHGPRLLLGHYDVGFNHAVSPGDERVYTDFIPFPPRPATTTTHLRHRLSLDFLLLPDGPFLNLLPTDSRGGLIAAGASVSWCKVVVVHPWTRQYRIRRVPFTPPEFSQENDYMVYKFLGAFFVDAAADGEAIISMFTFRVAYVTLVHDYYNDVITAQAYVYSARDDGWNVSETPPGNHDVNLLHFAWDGTRTLQMVHCFMGRAGGSLFWSGHRGQVLQLDENTMEFSTFALPMAPNDVGYTQTQDIVCMREANYHRWNLRVVVGGGGGAALRIVRIVDSDLEVFTRAHEDRECVLHRRVSLCQLANIKQQVIVPEPEPPWSFWETPSAGGAPRLMASSSAYELCVDVETMKPERNDMLYGGDRLLPYELPRPHNISDGL